MTTAYSAFFSSGLLAPHHDFTSNMNPSMSYYDVPIASPARPSSPMPIPGDSEIEDDAEGMDVDNESRTRRTRKSATPTPGPITSSISTSSSSSTTGSNTHVANAPRPRLRRRKSSLTVASSPMNAIKSPARTAGAALQLQRHLASPVRSRSGSLNLGAGMFGAEEGTGNVASEGTSLIGRMRSGSVGAALRSRRFVRRATSTPVPAPAPPPTMPLPALPPAAPSYSHHNTTSMKVNMRAPLTQRPQPHTTTGTTKTGRERAYSVDNGYFIDEEMKEN